MPTCGIMFHHFHDRKHAKGQGSLSAEEFAQVLAFLGRDRILSAEEWMRKAQAESLEDRDLCLTFDDNLRCQFDIAYPVLKDFGIRAFWFIYTSVFEGVPEKLEVYRHFRSTAFHDVEEFYQAFYRDINTSEFREIVEKSLERFQPSEYLADFPFYTEQDRRFRYVRDEVLGPARYFQLMDSMLDGARMDTRSLTNELWMTEECIQELHSQGHVIGLHSHTHPTRLGCLPPAQQEAEYRLNFECLSRVLDEPVSCVSHPCNSYDSSTLTFLRALGIKIGFRANMAQLSYSELEYPREDHANVFRRMKLS
jgi:peptidoglycan/xylan/chitin deacetylase (PgdA/CDA1 family)